MNTRGVIGQTIVAVHQRRAVDNCGSCCWAVDFIELDNGRRLIPSHTADEDMGFVEVQNLPPIPGRGKTRTHRAILLAACEAVCREWNKKPSEQDWTRIANLCGDALAKTKGDT